MLHVLQLRAQTNRCNVSSPSSELEAAYNTSAAAFGTIPRQEGKDGTTFSDDSVWVSNVLARLYATVYTWQEATPVLTPAIRRSSDGVAPRHGLLHRWVRLVDSQRDLQL